MAALWQIDHLALSGLIRAELISYQCHRSITLFRRDAQDSALLFRSKHKSAHPNVGSILKFAWSVLSFSTEKDLVLHKLKILQSN